MSAPDWRDRVRPFTVARDGFAAFQLVSTIGLYAGSLALLYWSLRLPLAATLILSIVSGGLLVRLFVLFHDCCHLSLFRSARLNECVGVLLSPFVFTSYFQWRLEHVHHHAQAGNLDKRGVGDIPTLTRREYAAAPRWKQLGYRLLRQPLLLFSVIAFATFTVVHRLFGPVGGRREKLGVIGTNVAMAIMVWIAGSWIGFGALAQIMIPTVAVAASAGIWLFYVQHQFPGAYWRHDDEWDFRDAALRGSSFYELPAVLRYLSGNIGYHHVHHLCPRIPNYRLRECHEALPELQVPPLTLSSSLACARLAVVDDDTLAPTHLQTNDAHTRR